MTGFRNPCVPLDLHSCGTAEDLTSFLENRLRILLHIFSLLPVMGQEKTNRELRNDFRLQGNFIVVLALRI